MRNKPAWLAAGALLLSGCVVREVHEIRYVSDPASRAPGGPPGAQEGAACDRCDASGAPGAVMAENQPPAPLEEEALDQPAPGTLWVDGYWHWNGVEWVWIPGSWVAPPIDGYVFLPPAYYAYGDQCLYVPGRWGYGNGMPPIVPVSGGVVVRDHRTRGGSVPVRDHRGEGVKPGKQPPLRDHRGEEPLPDKADVDREVIGSDMVLRVPARNPRNAVRARPDMGPAGGPADVVIDADVAPEIVRSTGASDDDGGPDILISAPRTRVPDRPAAASPPSGMDRGPMIQPGMVRPVVVPPSARMPTGWAPPVPTVRGAPPAQLSPPVRMAPPVHVSPPVRMAPAVRTPPPGTGGGPARAPGPSRSVSQPATAAPAQAAPAASPASGGNRAAPGPAARPSAPARAMSGGHRR